MDDGGKVLCDQALIFKIIDECPVSKGGVNNCNQCKMGDTNSFGKTFHFDIAVDAMNQDQYTKFYKGVTNGA